MSDAGNQVSESQDLEKVRYEEVVDSCDLWNSHSISQEKAREKEIRGKRRMGVRLGMVVIKR